MNKKILLFILAFVCSRVVFLFIDDPEGPNLLIVTILAVALYGLFSILYKYLGRR